MFQSEDAGVKLAQNRPYFHNDKLEHRIGIDIVIFSKELFDPSQPLANLDEVVGCL